MDDYANIVKTYKLEDVEEKYKNYLEKCRSLNENDVLYHYTSLTGLKGILSSQRFWLTDYNFLNDPLESHYSIELMRTIIAEKHNGFNQQVLQLFTNIFENSVKKYLICTISFCLKKNYLPAWRWYADDGAGFAIGFRPCMESYFRRENSTWIDANYHAEYDHEALKLYINDLLDLMVLKVKSVENKKDECFQKVGPIIAVHLLPFLAQCKHEAYQEEQEYRFVMGKRNFLEGGISLISISVLIVKKGAIF